MHWCEPLPINLCREWGSRGSAMNICGRGGHVRYVDGSMWWRGGCGHVRYVDGLSRAKLFVTCPLGVNTFRVWNVMRRCLRAFNSCGEEGARAINPCGEGRPHVTSLCAAEGPRAINPCWEGDPCAIHLCGKGGLCARSPPIRALPLPSRKPPGKLTRSACFPGGRIQQRDISRTTSPAAFLI